MSVTNTDWTALQQAEDMAYFKGDLCCYSPESYTLEEKKEICNDMMTTSKALLDAMRADFEQLPPEFRSKLLGMLCQSKVESPEWWWDVLVGEGDPLKLQLGIRHSLLPPDRVVLPEKGENFLPRRDTVHGNMES